MLNVLSRDMSLAYVYCAFYHMAIWPKMAVLAIYGHIGPYGHMPKNNKGRRVGYP